MGRVMLSSQRSNGTPPAGRVLRVAAGAPILVLIWAGVLAFLTAPATAFAQTSDSGQVVEAIKRRVGEFYSLLQRNQVKQAEAYVSRDSLEGFRTLTNNPFVGFEIRSVKVAPEGSSAAVEVTILFMDPRVPTPIPYARQTDWLLEDGEWRFAMPDPLKAFRQPSNRPANQQSAPALKFAEDRAQFGQIRQGEKKEVQVSFTNVSNQPARVTSIVTDCECIRAKTDKATYAPGEAGMITIEFEPGTNYLYYYQQTIVVKTDPGDLRSLLMVEANIQPLRRSAPKTQDAPPGPSSGGQ